MSRPGTRLRRAVAPVDTSARIGELELPSPLMTASGTAGHGTELASYLDVAALGAVVIKSLAPFPWAGNPVPRVHPVASGMLNSVGLQGPGVQAWLAEEHGPLADTGARIVVSLWGRSPEEYAEGVRQLTSAGGPPRGVIAIEANLSCPNIGGHGLIAHDPGAAAEVVAACAAWPGPTWAKLSPNTDRLVEVATACAGAGAAAVVLINTVMGLAIDVEARAPVLGGGAGGLSGAAIHPVAVRCVAEVSRSLPELPIVGVGGVRSGTDAVEMMMAGASAVGVGTATFAEPAALDRIGRELVAWCASHGVDRVADLVGVAR